MEKLYDLFNNKASLYAANRPSYSPNVLKYLQKDLGFSSTALGADIGCGTGQLTKILAEYFNLVYAVEPANFGSPVCVFRLNRCEHIALPVYGYGSSV